MSLEAGSRLGPYEILSLLGKGGMGEVNRARDTRLDRDVAIKVLPTELTGDKTYRKRLEWEGEDDLPALASERVHPLRRRVRGRDPRLGGGPGCRCFPSAEVGHFRGLS